MSHPESIVVTIDGESKCGKTTVIEAIAEEAQFQNDCIPELLAGNLVDREPFVLSDRIREGLTTLHRLSRFQTITTVSAGNSYRAAYLYKALAELEGRTITEFSPDDLGPIREILAIDGIKDFLQTDKGVGDGVSEVGRMVGVHVLCSALFCEEVAENFFADGGGNLVVADARDPVDHFRRNNLLGTQSDQINPENILPIYIDTRPAVAASRMNGVFSADLAKVIERREMDATRDELPVTVPERLLDDRDTWLKQITHPSQPGEVIDALRFQNHTRVTLGDIQRFAGEVASAANDWAIHLGARSA